MTKKKQDFLLCPFCGSPVEELPNDGREKAVYHQFSGCPLSNFAIPLENWNKRVHENITLSTNEDKEILIEQRKEFIICLHEDFGISYSLFKKDKWVPGQYDLSIEFPEDLYRQLISHKN